VIVLEITIFDLKLESLIGKDKKQVQGLVRLKVPEGIGGRPTIRS